jgi:hypothetical protein
MDHAAVTGNQRHDPGNVLAIDVTLHRGPDSRQAIRRHPHLFGSARRQSLARLREKSTQPGR